MCESDKEFVVFTNKRTKFSIFSYNFFSVKRKFLKIAQNFNRKIQKEIFLYIAMAFDVDDVFFLLLIFRTH